MTPLTNNDLCSIAEVAEPRSKMTLIYPKIAAIRQIQLKSLKQYFGSFLIQTNSIET